jgi:hypothetical protein
MKFETKNEVKEYLVSFMNEKTAKKFGRLTVEEQDHHSKSAYEYSRFIGDLGYMEAYAEQLELSL